MTASASLGTRVLLWGLLGISNTLWGASWVVSKLALQELAPLQLAAWRMIVAGMVLLPVVAWHAQRGNLPRTVWPLLALLGLGGAVLSKWFALWGVERSTAANAGLLMATEPAFTILLAALALRERLTPPRFASLALGAAGTYLIVFQKTGWPTLSGATVAGDAVFLVALVLEAAYSVGSKPLSRRHPPLAIAAASLVAALPVWIPIAAWSIADTGWPALSATGWAAVAYLSLGCTVFGYVVWVFALRHLDAGPVSLTVFLQPVVGTLLAVGVLGEQLTLPTLAGAALVLVSLGVLLYTPAPRLPLADQRVAK